MGTKRTQVLPPARVVPVERAALNAALTLFVTRFVVADKRTQMHARLLTAERRGETLVALRRWLQGTRSALAGADQSPTGIEARFGVLEGVLLDVSGARRTTIRGALELGRGHDSLWVGDSGRMALLSSPSEAPLLCSWP